MTIWMMVPLCMLVAALLLRWNVIGWALCRLGSHLWVDLLRPDEWWLPTRVGCHRCGRRL